MLNSYPQNQYSVSNIKLPHRFTLIGMSNSGKSFWSKRLEEFGFARLSSDDYIEEKLGQELKKLGYSGIADVSKWLGQPYDERHKKNSERYLRFEIESLKEFMTKLNKEWKDQNVVIDATGSAIYTGKDLLNKLKKSSMIIYLDTPLSVQEQMYLSYIENPKPVLWRQSYQKKDGESDMDALKRCYPELLSYRTRLYKQYADITLNYYLLRSKNFSVENFINIASGNF